MTNFWMLAYPHLAAAPSSLCPLLLTFPQCLSPISLHCTGIVHFLPSLDPSLAHQHHQTKNRCVVSFRNNSIAARRNTLCLEWGPESSLHTHCSGTAPSVWLWEISKGPWKVGSSGFEYFQVPCLKIGMDFCILTLEPAKSRRFKSLNYWHDISSLLMTSVRVWKRYCSQYEVNKIQNLRACILGITPVFSCHEHLELGKVIRLIKEPCCWFMKATT